MKTIRVKNQNFDVKEHKGINKITVHMPSTGAISGKQTTSIYTSDSLNLNNGIKFLTFNTFQCETLVVNTDYIIIVEQGKLVEVDGKDFYFVKEEYEVMHQGNYGTTQVSFAID